MIFSRDVGANNRYGTYYHVSPEGVKHTDKLNNLFAQQCQKNRGACE